MKVCEFGGKLAMCGVDNAHRTLSLFKTRETLALTCPPREKISKEQQLQAHHPKMRIHRSSPAGPAPKRGKLGDRWREFQGSNNWAGLLEPLDDRLRHEILRYGSLVEAAYQCFDFDPASPTYAARRRSYPKAPSSVLRGSGYQITRDLYATSGIHVPRWIGKVLAGAAVQCSWIGFVAVCTDEAEVERLGRRDVGIVYRGTCTCMEWVENLRATLTRLTVYESTSGADAPMVGSGFLSLYTSRTATCRSLQDMVREEIARLMEAYGNEPLSVTIMGHSLGAALAILTAYDIATAFDRAPSTTVFSFGGPRVGNRCFRRLLEESGGKVLRIVNTEDVVTRVPGFVVDEDEVAEGWRVGDVVTERWGYSDVGQELKLSSGEFPQLAKSDLVTSHDLKTYMSLVKGFAGPTTSIKPRVKGTFAIPFLLSGGKKLWGGHLNVPPRQKAMG